MNKTIIRIAKKENLSYKEIQYGYGVTAAEFEFPTYEEYYFYSGLFLKKKNLHVILFHHNHCFRVFDAEEYTRMRENNKRVISLVDLFYSSMHNGMTPDQAKREQEKYCELHPEFWATYDTIYA